MNEDCEGTVGFRITTSGGVVRIKVLLDPSEPIHFLLWPQHAHKLAAVIVAAADTAEREAKEGGWLWACD